MISENFVNKADHFKKNKLVQLFTNSAEIYDECLITFLKPRQIGKIVVGIIITDCPFPAHDSGQTNVDKVSK